MQWRPKHASTEPRWSVGAESSWHTTIIAAHLLFPSLKNIFWSKHLDWTVASIFCLCEFLVLQFYEFLSFQLFRFTVFEFFSFSFSRFRVFSFMSYSFLSLTLMELWLSILIADSFSRLKTWNEKPGKHPAEHVLKSITGWIRLI